MGKVGNGSVNDTEMTSEASQTPLDCGLGALVMLLRFQGIGIDPKQIRHQFAATPIGVPEMLRFSGK